ncbi:hypothetical protein OMP44_15730 [Pseudomonas sp. CBMAI 2609]|uniref:Uncharacterized protein n=1 Tax=Pseudomonas flavocrustae TaxID=2991719 RepID=A0ABT6IJV6_9PSED|nr:hypothetical protein [Pseudomonas sp. CBMAI 2609]MDH4764339.1 hypothetical protein [Pseudomonas sp. CBMAI 2609]
MRIGVNKEVGALIDDLVSPECDRRQLLADRCCFADPQLTDRGKGTAR